MNLRISIKQIILEMVQHMPSPLIRLAYKLPFIAGLGSRLLKHTAASGQSAIVTIRQGPLAGKKLQIDSQTPHYYWIKGHDEPVVLQIMQNNVKPGHCVVDVGAHIGIETLMLSQWVGAAGHVVSIEPDPSNFKALSANIRLNAVDNVQLIQAAISDNSGQLQFVHGEGVLCHLVDNPVDPSIDPTSLITVQVHTLDELFAGKQIIIDFLKIDVEDFEVSVLRGARRLLYEQQPTIIVELHSYRSARGCADILNQAGYNIELIDTPEKDLDRYLKTQPQMDYNHGFGRCHLLAKPSRD
jgi:FkbM family methyltransferase